MFAAQMFLQMLTSSRKAKDEMKLNHCLSNLKLDVWTQPVIVMLPFQISITLRALFDVVTVWSKATPLKQ